MTCSQDRSPDSLLGPPRKKVLITRYKMLEPPETVVLSFSPLMVGSNIDLSLPSDQAVQSQTWFLDLSLILPKEILLIELKFTMTYL